VFQRTQILEIRKCHITWPSAVIIVVYSGLEQFIYSNPVRPLGGFDTTEENLKPLLYFTSLKVLRLVRNTVCYHNAASDGQTSTTKVIKFLDDHRHSFGGQTPLLINEKLEEKKIDAGTMAV
jgi:hypothetical protein